MPVGGPFFTGATLSVRIEIDDMTLRFDGDWKGNGKVIQVMAD